jgi:hypothetical protein
MNDIDNGRERATLWRTASPSSGRRLAAAIALAVVLGTAACGPDKSVPPSSGPWAACPHGEHRIKDGWLDWRHQWVCE